MGVIRGFAIIIISILLFLAVLIAGIFSTVSLSLTYDNVQQKVYPIVLNVVETQVGTEVITEQFMPYASAYCQNNENTEIVQEIEGYTFVFPCTVVQEGYDSVFNYSVNYLVHDFYYKEYNCTFKECFAESSVPLFLVSDYARQFWKSLFFKFFIAALILACLAFLIVEKISNAPVLVGSITIIASLIVLSFKKIGGIIVNAILSPISAALSSENIKDILSQVVAMFFSESSSVFLWMFVLGLILIALGIVFKITGIGFSIGKKIEDLKSKISNQESVSKSEVREIVKEEISKKNTSKLKSNIKKKGSIGNI